MLKKKLFGWVVAPLIAIVAVTAFSSFTGEDESGGTGCDLCVVKVDNVLLFSCKPASNSTCSKDQMMNIPGKGEVKVKVSCAGAVAC